MDQILQILGALAVLVAYVAAQLRRLDQSSWIYLVLNLVGGAILAVLAAMGRNWGFLLLEGTWALVAAGGIATRLRSRAR